MDLQFFPRTATLTLAVISTSICIPIVTMLFMDQIHQSIQEQYIHKDYHLQVHSFGISVDDILELIKQHTMLKKEAQYIVPFYQRDALIQDESGNYASVLFKGIQSNYYQNNFKLNQQFPLIAGSYNLKNTFDIIVTNALIKKITKTKNSYTRLIQKLKKFKSINIHLLAPQRQKTLFIPELSQTQPTIPNLSTYQMRIIGIVESRQADYAKDIVFSNLNTAKIVFNLKKTNLFDNIKIGIVLKNTSKLSTVHSKLKNDYPYLSIHDWTIFYGNMLHAFRWEKQVMSLVVIIILFVSVVIALSINLNILLVSKKKEIAILKTLGVTNRNLRLVFTIQGVLLSSIAIVIGTIASLIIFYASIGMFAALQTINQNIIPEKWMQLSTMLYPIDIRNILLIDGLCLIVSLFASFIPSKKIVHQRINHVIKEVEY